MVVIRLALPFAFRSTKYSHMVVEVPPCQCALFTLVLFECVGISGS